MGAVDVRTADIEKGQGPSDGSPAASGSFSTMSYVIAMIGAVIFFAWTIVIIVTQANATATTLNASKIVNQYEQYPYIAQASTFAIGLSAAWYTDVHGSDFHAACTSIYNWLVVCFWFIYVLPGNLFWAWTHNSIVISCSGAFKNDDLCNEFKTAAIFSLFIVILHFAMCLIYAMKGFTALFKFNGIRSAYLLLVALNLIAFILWFAGQLAYNDKMNALTAGSAAYYIVTLSVAVCTILMIGMMNDVSSATIFSLIWHPLTAGMLWSFVIMMTRAADDKPTVQGVPEQTKTITAGIQIMAIVETMAAVLTAIIHFKGNFM